MKIHYIFLLSLLVTDLMAQKVETVHEHRSIVDGLFVDESGDIFTTSGGLVGGRNIGKYDISNSTYQEDYARGFAGPINISKYKDSLLIVTNFDNSSVYSYDISSSETKAIANNLDGPAGIAISKNDDIYITNWGQAPTWRGHQIHKISNDGELSVFLDSAILNRPQAIIITPEDEMIVHSQKKLYKIDLETKEITLWVQLDYHIGNMVYRKKDNSIYGAANKANKIIKINYDKEVSVFTGGQAGFKDGLLKEALFSKPLGIAFSPSEDTLYVAEAGPANRLRRIIMNATENNRPAKTNSVSKATQIGKNRDFDFWIGKWNTISKNLPNWAPKKGLDSVGYLLDGNLIEEKFRKDEGSIFQRGYLYFLARENRWQHIIYDVKWGEYSFYGNREGDRIILTSKPSSTRPGRRREVFYNITEDSFDYMWEQSNDNGKTWKKTWEVKYTRAKN